MSKELKIGLLAVVAAVLLYFGFQFLKGSDFLSTTNTYFVVYDKIDGLTVSNPVMVNGFAVGRVQAIEILAKENYKLKVTLVVDRNLQLGETTEAVLTDNGLLGGKMIELKMGVVNKPLASGASLKASKAGGLLATLQDKAGPLVSKLDSITTKVNNLLGEFAGSGKKINNILGNFEGISASLKHGLGESLENITQLTRNLKNLSASLVETERKLKPILDNAKTFTDKLAALELAKTLDNANQTVAKLNKMLDQVDKGEGTIGALMKNDSLYRNLSNLSKNLDRLFVDIRENPKRYVQLSVFGKKDKEETQKKKK